MDLMSSFKRRSYPSRYTDQRSRELSRSSQRRFGFSTMTLTKISASCLIVLSVMILLSLIFHRDPSDHLVGFADARILDGRDRLNVSLPTVGLADPRSQVNELHKDKLLGGLLAAGFDENTCLSRYQSVLYRKKSPYQPSPYLLSKLRNYEQLHKRCGPHTESYNRAGEQLKSNSSSIGSTDCKYIVWISFSGLGNRILTLASAFLYALLTDRVLLVDRGKDMADLFCEPFPESSWFLPQDFPITHRFNSFDGESPQCYGKMLKNNTINASSELLPSYLYLHLAHDYGEHDKLFFCDGEQAVLRKVPWLIMKSNNYFVPSLFLIPSFEAELSKLFPEKGTVFHHLGRYLLHPSNHVWALITRYYDAYLAKADERIGIQVRVFDPNPGPFQYVMDQISACTLKEKLLPEVAMKESDPVIHPSEKSKVKAVLMTSLSLGYFENMRNIYWEHPTVNGDLVAIFQPSHEGYQQTENDLHNKKAFAEMYLLSLTDALVTSAWSTFGYVAQGLGGLKPWILYKAENQTTPDPPCRRAMSMEPCFHAPPFYDCKNKRGTDTGALVPHVRHCEDMSWGLKVVDSHDEL